MKWYSLFDGWKLMAGLDGEIDGGHHMTTFWNASYMYTWSIGCVSTLQSLDHDQLLMKEDM